MTFYRALLLLYPSSFRGQYGQELSSIFAHRLKSASNPFAWLLLWMEALLDVFVNAVRTHLDLLHQDVRYTLRAVRRAPGFAATVVLVAALGVGATTAAYTIIDHVLIRPLPFPDPQRLVNVWEDMTPGSYNEMEPSPANYRDWKQMSKSFSAMGAVRDLSLSMVGVGDPEQVIGAAMTADLFPMLGARTVLGRVLTAQDDTPTATRTVMLSYGFWQKRFASDPGVIGRRILLEGDPYVVVGVMAPNFNFPLRTAQIWTAMRFENRDFEDRNNNYLDVVARLAPGVSIDQARSEMRIISERLKRQYPKDNEHVAVNLVPLRDDGINSRARVMLMALLGASFCVLLIACANVAGLLLARALVRRREIAVRNALGAGRERLVRQMLTENLLLALCGGALGVLIASLAVPLFAKLIPTWLPIAATPSVDSRVLLFALLLTLATGICFGVLPAARAASGITVTALQEGSRQGVGGRRERLRGMLVMAETAISLVLLVSSGLLIRALWQVEQTNPGFRTENVLTLETALPEPKYDSTARRVEFYTHVLSGVRALPGVTAAGYISFMPMGGLTGGIWPVTLPGQPPNTDRAFHQASLRFATPGFFEALRIPVLRGRGVSESDTGSSQYVAVVSESFARQFWPNQDPLGRQFHFGLADRTVVGVAGDVRVRGLERPSEPQVYLPYKQVKDGNIIWYAPKDLAIRCTVGMENLLPAVRRIIAEADPQQPISDVRMLSELVDDQTAPRRIQVRVLGGFALIAIFLAGIGIHGLLSFTVANRSQEIGVRMAVGAQAGDILAMVLRESAWLAMAGTAVGVALAWAAGRALQSVLVGVQPLDLATWATAIVLVVCMTLAGSFVPALRAVRVDPLSAIRAE
jgi:predicted permease